MNWQPAETAPKDGSWIVVKKDESCLFTVRWCTPFLNAPELADWRDERGRVRWFTMWKAV